MPRVIIIGGCRHVHICPSCTTYKRSLLPSWNKIRSRNRCDVVWVQHMWLFPYLEIALLHWCSQELQVQGVGPGMCSTYPRPHPGMGWGRALTQSAQIISLAPQRAEKHLGNTVDCTGGSNNWWLAPGSEEWKAQSDEWAVSQQFHPNMDDVVSYTVTWVVVCSLVETEQVYVEQQFHLLLKRRAVLQLTARWLFFFGGLFYRTSL